MVEISKDGISCSFSVWYFWSKNQFASLCSWNQHLQGKGRWVTLGKRKWIWDDAFHTLKHWSKPQAFPAFLKLKCIYRAPSVENENGMHRDHTTCSMSFAFDLHFLSPSLESFLGRGPTNPQDPGSGHS